MTDHSSPENADADVLIERLKYFSGWSCRDPGLDMTPTHYLIWDAIDEITRLRSLIRAQGAASPFPCPYNIDGCVLENSEIGPCLCALTSPESRS